MYRNFTICIIMLSAGIISITIGSVKSDPKVYRQSKENIMYTKHKEARAPPRMIGNLSRSYVTAIIGITPPIPSNMKMEKPTIVQ